MVPQNLDETCKLVTVKICLTFMGPCIVSLFQYIFNMFNPQVSSKGFWHGTLGPYFELLGFFYLC